MLTKRIINKISLVLFIWVYLKAWSVIIVKTGTSIQLVADTPINRLCVLIAIGIPALIICVGITQIMFLMVTGEADGWLERNIEPHVKKLYAWFDRRNNHSA